MYSIKMKEGKHAHFEGRWGPSDTPQHHVKSIKWSSNKDPTKNNSPCHQAKDHPTPPAKDNPQTAK